MIAATIGNGDYFSLSIPLTFAPGSANGAEICAPVNARIDNLVEEEENFTVVLTLSTAGESLSLGNNVTTIILNSSDGTNYYENLPS
jgi:hypothetical protein